MDLFEYQGKQLLAAQGIPVPSGEVAETPEEARAAAERIGGKVAIKAQVQVGGRPANFLDAGGGSKADDVVTALEVLLSDDKVKALLVNIFGGITRCDEVAEGLLTALDRLGATLPIVVRLDGTNEEEGRTIIRERAPQNVVVEETMLSAARRAVELAKEAA